MRLRLCLTVCALAILEVVASVEFATSPPPTGGDDLTVQVVPGWAERTANAVALCGHVAPMEGNAPAVWRCAGAVELPARFKDNPIVRASWDIDCKIDLSGHAGTFSWREACFRRVGEGCVFAQARKEKLGGRTAAERQSP